MRSKLVVALLVLAALAAPSAALAGPGAPKQATAEGSGGAAATVDQAGTEKLVWQTCEVLHMLRDIIDYLAPILNPGVARERMELHTVAVPDRYSLAPEEVVQRQRLL